MRTAITILFVASGCTAVADVRAIEGTEKFRGDATGTVAWTGPEGLNVRDVPSTTGTRVGWLPQGAKVTIVCQTSGDTVQGNDVWDRLAEPDGFVADAYMKTGHADLIPGVPICGETDDGCGDVDWLGECDDDTLVWCEDDTLQWVDCAASGRTCGWQDDDIGHNCLGGAPPELVVNGHELRPQEAEWIAYVAAHVVPQLAGTRHQRLTTAARVAWWSLKEGVLMLDGALGYSNCNRPWGDEHIGPLVSCDANRAWQVGLSGSQVPWPAIDVEATALALFPGQDLADVLWTTATAAGFPPGSSEIGAAIVGSGGSLRRSWLLRNPVVGFTNQVEVVTGECIDQSLSWCYGAGWDESARYAPHRAAALGAMDDLYAIFDALAP